jgi:hypothetical protein
MGWIAIISAAINLLGRLAAYLADRRLIEAGSAEAIARGLRETLDNLEVARRAADAVINPITADDRDYAERVRDRFKRPDE